MSIPDSPVASTAVLLCSLVAAVLILPFLSKKVEENLEVFFLVIGLAAVSVSRLWHMSLVWEAVKAPVMIGRLPIGVFQVILVFGFLMHAFHAYFTRLILRMDRILGHRLFLFFLIALVSLLSSVITVILAASLLAEIVAAVPMARTEKKKLVIMACFAAGMGACLSPLGEPLSTILVAKLSGPPHHAGFFFPLRHFGVPIAIGVLALSGVAALRFGPRMSRPAQEAHSDGFETGKAIVLRAVKVYLFIAALVLIGEGFKPLMVWYLIKIPPLGLYWINMSSAVLDNATLAAIEIGPAMALPQIIGVVLGLTISGGMLIPGNIPNIVAAGRLKISMGEWAVAGIPLGLVLMATYFVAIFVL